MMRANKPSRPISQHATRGFTIVELLIVIIVIGILAALILVAYSSVTDQAKVSAVKNDLENITKQLANYRESNGGAAYPADASSLQYSNGTMLQYTVNNAASPATYCVTAVNGNAAYYTSSNANAPTAGYCSDAGYDTIGWWKFNGNGLDSSTTGANASLNSVTLTTGQNGTANGAYQQTESSSMTVGKPASFNTLATSGLTYSLWAKRTGTGTSNQWPSLMGGDGHTNIIIRASGYGAYVYEEYGRTPFDGTAFTGLTGYNAPLNEWHMYTATYSSGTFSLYVDGKLLSTSPNTINSNTGPVNFGGWVGSDDDARVYNRPLSAAEIASLYAKGAQ